MNCTPYKIKAPDGQVVYGFACSRGASRGPKCFVSSCSLVAEKLCDWPFAHNKTCDRPCCRRHAYMIDPAGIDYCPQHYADHKAAKEPKP